jgi:succinoglycan biosynthesis transport protein ExoP
MDKKLFSPVKNDLTGHYRSVSSPNYLASTPEEDDQVLDMNWVIAVVKRRLLVMTIVAASIATLSGGFIISKDKKIVPQYEGKFTVLVEPITADDRLSKLLAQSQSNGLGLKDLDKLNHQRNPVPRWIIKV